MDTATGKVIGAGGKVIATIETGNPAPEDGTSYAADTTKGSVEVAVADVDSPGDATWSIALVDDTLTEGESTAVTVSTTNGYVFSTDQTVKIRWNELDLATPLDLQGGATDDTVTLAARSSSASATLAYTDGLRRNAYTTGTVGTATAKLTARVGTSDEAETDLTLEDDEGVPQLTVTLPQQVEEGDDITLSLSVEPAADYLIYVSLSFSDPNSALSGTPSSNMQFSPAQDSISQALTTAEDIIDTDPPDTKAVSISISDPTVDSVITNPADAVSLVDGARAIEVEVLDDDERPAQPVVHAVTRGDETATATWSTGDAGTQPITGYEYRISADDGVNWDPDWTAITNSDANTVSLTVSGLRNATGYTFEIRAVSDAGKGYQALRTAAPYSTHIPDGGAAPTDFLYRLGSPVVSENAPDYLQWRAPGWYMRHRSGYAFNHLIGYEIDVHTMGTETDWTGWEQILDYDDTGRISGTNDGSVRLSNVELAGECELKQWRLRAYYWDPPRHSNWVYTYDERRPDPAPPPRTEISGNDQSFVETGDDAYRLSFVWKNTAAPCWTNLEYQVQHRTFVGRWHGTPADPYDGDVLNNGVVYDSLTMTAEGGRVWTTWQDTATYEAADKPDRRHVIEFEGKTSYQLRVRARNTYGWSPWSNDWLFSFGIRGRWAAHTTYVQYR